jgi:predicted O-methyltransferase YrrM
MTTHALLKRIRQGKSLSKAMITRGAGKTLHLIELLLSSDSTALPSISLKDVLNLVGGETATSVKMHSSLRGNGSGSIAEMAAIATITAAKRPSRILEFGTFDGASTWHLFENAPDNCTLTTLDLPGGAQSEGSTDLGLQGAAGARPFLPRDPRVRLVEIDSRQWIPDTSDVDLCFIDGGHSYECVRNDTEKALQVMREDGVILWHDAAWKHDGYGVYRYLNELRSKGHNIHILHLGPFDYCGLALRLPGKIN